MLIAAAVVSGTSAQAARQRVFDSPLSRPANAQQHNVGSPHWRSFQAQFFRRRWVVPAMAAAIRPEAGQRALPDVAIVGYLAFAAVLAALLASRFGLVASIPAAVLCLALGPVRDWATRPMTDSWGLVFSVGAVLAALLVLRRGWSYVAHHYVSFSATTIKADVSYAVHHPAAGLTLLAGLVPFFLIRSGRDPLTLMMRGWALGWPILFLINPVYSGFRYEIAILPAAAVGLCMFIEWLGDRVARRQVGVVGREAPPALTSTADRIAAP
jgi:hypothetical protein